MKIVISHKPGQPIWDGVAGALSTLGHEVVAWQPKVKPVNDMAVEISPDMLIIEPDDVTHSFPAALDRCDAKLVMMGVGSWDELTPDLFCVTHHTPETILKNLDSPWVRMTHCADLAHFPIVDGDERYMSDVLCIVDRPIGIEQMDVLYNHIVDGERVFVVGEFRVPMPQYLGQVTTRETSLLMASTKLGICFDEQHPHDYAIRDTPVHSSVPPEQLNLRETYYHRVAEIFGVLGYEKESQKAMEKVPQ